MTTSVAPGTAAVALTSAANLTQLCRWDAAEVVTHAAAPPAGSSRIDLVVLQVRDATLDAGGNNDFIFQAIAGAGGTPGPGAVPAVPTNAYAMGQLTVPGGAANLNGVTVVDRRVPISPRDTLQCHVHRTAAWSIATGPAAMLFDTVDWDTWGVYNTANGRFTVPLPGLYLFQGAVNVTNMAAGSWIQATLMKNGAAIGGATIIQSSAAGSLLSLAPTAMWTAVAGDYFSWAFWSSVSQAASTGGGILGSMAYLGTG
jgi:hypothetical protein